MIHDELLEELDDIAMTMKQNKLPLTSKYIQSLRAVVELHKPMNLYAHLCDGCYEEESGHSDYPCPTIQAIEKELK